MGLGGQPTLLGRADDVRVFIMHTKNTATIEIELAPRPTDTKPPILKRVIDREKGSTSERSRGVGANTYYINNKKVNIKQVQDLVSGEYGISVANLCTFLPQDKVGSFSGFTPIQLLTETEKAIGMDTVYKPHLDLQKLQDEVNNGDNEVGNMQKTLQEKLKQNESLEREKELMEKRKEAQEKIAYLKKKKIWLVFDKERERAVELKEARDRAKITYKEAEKKIEPLKRKVSQMEHEATRMQSQTKQLERAHDKIQGHCVQNKTKAVQFSDRMEEEVANLDNIDTQQAQAEKRVEKDQQSVEETTAYINQNYQNIDEVDVELNQTNQDLKDMRKQVKKAQDNVLRVNDHVRDLQSTHQQLEYKLQQMNDEKSRRREHVFRQSYNKNIAKSYQWIDQNRKMFRRPIHGPIVCEVTMKSKNASAYLEQHCSTAILKAYVVECKEDYNLLFNEVRTKRNIPINIQIVPNGKLIEPIPRMYSAQKMRILREQHGVLGYLDESFDAPPAVVQALISTSHINSVLVGNEVTQESLDNRGLLDYLTAQETNDGRNRLMNACIFSCQRNKSFKYTSTVSRYSGKANVRIDEIAPAQMLTEGVDQNKKIELERALKEQETELQQWKPQLEQLEAKRVELVSNGQEIGMHLKELRARKDDYSKACAKLNHQKRKLEQSIESANSDFVQQKIETQNRIKKFVTMTISALEKLGVTQQEMMDITRQLAGMKMSSDGFISAYSRLNRRLKEKQESFEYLKREHDKAVVAYNEARIEMKRLNKQAIQIAPLQDPRTGEDLPLKAKLEELPDSLEGVIAEIEDNENTIESISDNPQVMKLYEQRKLEIAALKNELETHQDNHNTKKLQMEQLATEWKARLKNTVDSVSTLFTEYMKELGCAGEIRLAEADSFKDWGIEIWVQFRAKASLQILSAQMQSGGERSVSTIMYLMALQELMISPFRCVDEINQGLDERNERLVFKRIVANSTKSKTNSRTGEKEHNGQYVSKRGIASVLCVCCFLFMC